MPMGSAYNADTWAGFFSAQIAASAALAGLIFVAVSINLAQIVKLPQLVARSAKAVFTLTGVLLVSTLCMVPAQPARALGAELAVVGVVLWVATTWSRHRAGHANPYVSRRLQVFYMVLAQCSSLPAVVAAASLMVLRGGGLYWLVAGVVFSYFSAMLDAWVLLVEIQR
ncbi:MAG: hypothetical protein WBD98_03240 [Acidobacteriaceae bacterium]